MELAENTDVEAARAAMELQALRLEEHALRQFAKDVGLEESWDTDDPPRRSTRARPSNPISTATGREFVAIRDNTEGRYWPIYEQEIDILRNLAATRNLASYDSTAIGAGQSLRSYVLSGEWMVNATVDERDAKKSQAARKVQYEIDRTLDRWEFWDVQLPTIVDEGRSDGEKFPCLYPLRNGDIALDYMAVEQCREPTNKFALNEWLSEPDSTWYFGVHCRTAEYANRPDWSRPLGYHFVEDDAGRDWEYLPSWPQPNVLEDTRCCYHYKRNAPMKAARGVSDYYPILADLERAYKIFRNVGDGAAIQAAIAMIIQRASGSRVATVNDVAGNAIDTVNRMRATGGGMSTYVRQYPSGSVVETDKDSVYNPGPMGQPSGQNFIDVAQAILRARISVRWNMPEYLISGDASNQAYASSLVSESPFVKYCEREQVVIKGVIQNLLWRVLRMKYIAGRFPEYSTWEQFEAAVDLDIVAGEVASRDVVAQTQRFATLHEKGIITSQYWAQKEGVPEEDVREVPQDAGHGLGVAGVSGQPAASQQQGEQLNGAQVNAAVDVMVQLRQNIIVPTAAVSLLTAIGIPLAKAQAMVDQTSSAPPLQSNDAEQVSIADKLTSGATESIQESWNRIWRGYP